MRKPYELLESLLCNIEEKLTEDINTDTLADEYSLSATHLRRLFQFAFNQTIGAYIRSRKLSASIDNIINTNLNILDIAILYGFEYEQTYIRSFKREFGITPGDLRKTGKILTIKPPLHLFDSNKIADGAFFGPDIVMVPQFHVIGRKHKMPLNCELSSLPTFHFNNFINKEKNKIANAVNREIIINISTEVEIKNADYGYFMPSLQVKSFDNIPDGFNSFTFPSTLCARFKLIKPDDIELNETFAEKLFNIIDNFISNNNQKYIIDKNGMVMDIFDPTSFGGSYKSWQWLKPVKFPAEPEPKHINQSPYSFIGKESNKYSHKPQVKMK